MHSCGRGYSCTCTSLAAGLVPVHANSAYMLSLRRGFCTFNSASLILHLVASYSVCTCKLVSPHPLAYQTVGNIPFAVNAYTRWALYFTLVPGKVVSP